MQILRLGESELVQYRSDQDKAGVRVWAGPRSGNWSDTGPGETKAGEWLQLQSGTIWQTGALQTCLYQKEQVRLIVDNEMSETETVNLNRVKAES